jgi:hypothetical protein
MTDDETFDEHSARAGVAAEKPPDGSTPAVAEVARGTGCFTSTSSSPR